MDFERTDYFTQRIELVRVDVGGVQPARPSGLPGWIAGLRQVLPRPLFLVLVAAPTFLAALYFFGFAAVRYELEAQFVVRSPTTAATNQLSGVVQGDPSAMRSSDDAYIVKDFILSRDAMDYLVKNADLREIFARPEADFLWKYPEPLRRDNSEGLYRHYLRFVSVDYDDTAGIAVLRVQGFRPGDAQKVAQALVVRSEALINDLNDRSTSDAVRSARQEVENSQERAHEALDALRLYREREKLIDPTQTSAAAIQTIESSVQDARRNQRGDERRRQDDPG